jgi:hypothetical protein
MKYSFLLSFLIGGIILKPNFAQAQKLDTTAINKIGFEIFETFKNESFNDFEKHLSKSVFRSFFYKKIKLKERLKLKKGYREYLKTNEYIFNKIIAEGKSQGIEWENVTFEGFIYQVEEAKNGTSCLDLEIILKFKDENYSITVLFADYKGVYKPIYCIGLQNISNETIIIRS